MGKVIHWELCKKFQFDHMNKCCMHNPESILENETYKLLWRFEIQTDHLILARRPDLIIINKIERTCRIVDFAVLVDLRKIERKQKEGKVPGPCLGIEKNVEHESDNYTNCNWCSWYSYQGIGIRTGGFGNKGMGRDYLNFSISVIGQNTEESPGDLGDLLSFKLHESPSANAVVKSSQEVDG